MAGITQTWPWRNFEPVIRYGEVDAEGFDEFVEHTEPEMRLSVGLDYWFTPSLAFKVAGLWRDFDDPAKDDATEFRAQLAYGF